MKLNDKQKQFLFFKDYLTAKVLDACEEQGWKNYFIQYFEWELVESSWGGSWYRVVLIDKKTKEIYYDVSVNFQGKDFQKLMKL